MGFTWSRPGPYAGESRMERLERFRRNEQENLEAMSAAGITVHAPKLLFCPRCRLLEDAVFWTPLGRKRGELLLGCPSCGRKATRYSLSNGGVGGGTSSGVRVRLRSALPVALVVMVTVGGLAMGGATSDRFRLGVRTIQSTWAGMPSSEHIAAGLYRLSPSGTEAREILLARPGDRRKRLPGTLLESGLEPEYDAASDVTVLRVPRRAAAVADSLLRHGWSRL